MERVVQSVTGHTANMTSSGRGLAFVTSSIFNSLSVALPPRTHIDAIFIGLMAGFCLFLVLVLLSVFLRRLLGSQLSRSTRRFYKLMKKHFEKSNTQQERQIALMTRCNTLLARQIAVGSANKALQEQQIALTIKNNALLEQQVSLILENNALQERMIALDSKNSAEISELKTAIIEINRILAASVPPPGALSSGPFGS